MLDRDAIAPVRSQSGQLPMGKQRIIVGAEIAMAVTMNYKVRTVFTGIFITGSTP